MASENEKITPDQWAALVMDVLGSQPELAAVTVTAMQRGLLLAIDSSKERNVTLSRGLHAALQTERRAKTRDHEAIIQAVEASTFHHTPWSERAIERERKSRDRNAQA